jgi:glyoxylase-like metal-dependent hydrolase (beta-lactamase superfamily II)
VTQSGAARSGAPRLREIADGVYCLRSRGSNVYLVAAGSTWVLIDAGWGRSGPAIRAAARAVFGGRVRPAAILLTHAHPDHAGAAAELARLWGVSMYVHRDDAPLLTRDALANWGLLDPAARWAMAPLRLLLPRRTLERMTASDLGDVIRPLPSDDQTVPALPDWRCVPTPGHSAGHVAFHRESDGVVIAGDAVLTAPLSGLLSCAQKISPPPRVSTWDWRRAKRSVVVLAALRPRVLASGHGRPMAGPYVAGELQEFSDRFSDAGS